MTLLVEHDFPAGTPVKVIVNCAQTEQQPKAGFTDALREDALRLLVKGRGDQAVKIVAEARRLDALEPHVTVRPFDAAELAELADREAAWLDELAERERGACDAALRLTDWTQMPDAADRLPAGTTAQQWANYRKAVHKRRGAIKAAGKVPAWPKPPAAVTGLPVPSAS